MRTLVESESTFDQVNTFKVKMPNGAAITASLIKNYHSQGDGIYWALNSGTVIKASYTEDDLAERIRLATEEPVENGEIVLIDGDHYSVEVEGYFSDCAVFNKIT